MLMNWKDSGTSTKSDAEVNRLVNDVLLDPDFKLEDLKASMWLERINGVILLRRNLPFLTLFKWPTPIFKFLPVPAEYHQAHFLFQDWSIKN